MRLNVYVKYKKFPGLYTNDRELIRYLSKSKDFRIWYIVFKNKKLDGVAFLYKRRGFIGEVKEIVQRWKKTR
jgi:hypothetical protein